MFTKYYTTPQQLVPLKLAIKSLITMSPRKRLALNMRQNDYQNLLKNNNLELFRLHHDLTMILESQSSEYHAYDYGEGYFYQSNKEIGITGFRDTEKRIERYNLKNILKSKKILDIGCNAGFILTSLADYIDSGTGFDINPYLVKIAETVIQYKKIKNLKFMTTSFENLETDQKYTALLSFANHSTYDQQTKQSLQSYFTKCYDLLEKDGLFVFESHPPELDTQEKLTECISIIGSKFEIISCQLYTNGNFLDCNRTLVLARKNL